MLNLAVLEPPARRPLLSWLSGSSTSGAAAVSCLGAVAQVHRAVAEPALIHQFELKPDPVGEEQLAAAQHDGPLELRDRPSAPYVAAVSLAGNYPAEAV